MKKGKKGSSRKMRVRVGEDWDDAVIKTTKLGVRLALARLPLLTLTIIVSFVIVLAVLAYGMATHDHVLIDKVLELAKHVIYGLTTG